jgi:hypothetical protein
VATHIPTHIGDVLILKTTTTYTIYAVGRVSEDGQQDFGIPSDVSHANDYLAALAQATALLAPGQHMFLLNIDTDQWSEIPQKPPVRH